MVVTNGQAVLQHTRMERTEPKAIDGWWTYFAPWWGYDSTNNWNVKLQPGSTVELRAEIGPLTQDDTFAGIGVSTLENDGYVLLLERNEIALMKTGNAVLTSFTSYFFWRQVTLPRTNLTVSVAFTQVDSSLQIYIRIFDPMETLVWEKKVTDTAKADAVLANRAIRGLIMEPEGIPGPYVGVDLLPLVGVSYINTTKAPTNAVEVTFDSFEVLTYETPVLNVEPSLLLSWQEDTFEDQIVVATDSLTNKVWTPCPRTLFKGDGQLCMAVPTTAKQQFFKLVPGVQFADDFSPAKAPFSTRMPYTLTWSHAGDSVSVTNDVMRIFTQGPVNGGFTINPPLLSAQTADFHASVDILDWVTSANNWGCIGIIGRGVYYDANSGNGFIGSLVLNPSGVKGKVQLQFWDGGTTIFGPSFTYQMGTPYRLQFSAVGRNLLIRVLNLQTMEVVKEMKYSSSAFQKGGICLWVGTQESVRQTHEIILDNFFATGTKPAVN
jgi:hypothetical protein